MTKMKLLKFMVTNFRSVENSGWVTLDEVTSFIGINESGKSNLLLPLWKLNPAHGGEINLLSDMPRKKYNVMRDEKEKYDFITAHFEVTDILREQLDELLIENADELDVVAISRRYDGRRAISWPNKKVTYTEANQEAALAAVMEEVPKFVYYSNYGNLDSDIYLPQAISNMSRKDLTNKEEAKARTLRVLFDFVKLNAQEILSLGQNDGVNEAQMEKKKEREVLLQSAASRLTKEFGDWWKQGDYQFQLRADGNFFKIWVADKIRPEFIELEGRSTGLQWFLSFFLVFLSEAENSHDGCILLLDEPGLTLHPLAQKDLVEFFENLSQHNQIIYSTHSPFLIESDKMDQVRAVYINTKGETEVTADLRRAAPGSVKSKSIYAAHAALGLSVSEGLLNGCYPIVVEGPSDQNYLNLIKAKLMRAGLLKTTKEVIFLPGGGGKGIRSIAPIISGKMDELPFVLLDSDEQGQQTASALKSGLYQNEKNKVVLIGEITKREKTEVEDLIDTSFVAKTFSKIFHSPSADKDFDEVYSVELPIVDQMETYALKNGIELPNGWKVDLSREIKRKSLLDTSSDPSPQRSGLWLDLFDRLGISETTQTKVGAPPAKSTKGKHPSDRKSAARLIRFQFPVWSFAHRRSRIAHGPAVRTLLQKIGFAL